MARPRTAAAVSVIAAGTLLALTAATPSSAQPVTSSARKTVVQTAGQPLQPDQAAALRRALQDNPNLTEAQAEAVIAGGGTSTAGVVQPDGHGTASGNCGNASLFGYSNGNYGLAMFFNATVGPPVAGSVAISTNGVFPATDYHPIPPTSASGRLWETGAIADATTASGWALTSNAWYCVLSVTAYW